MAFLRVCVCCVYVFSATKKHSVIIPKKASAASKNLLNGALKGKMKGKVGKGKGNKQSSVSDIVSLTGAHTSFFALIRHLFSGCTDHRSSMHRLEEKVLLWQNSDSVINCDWAMEESSWVSLLLPGLRYLAGEDGGKYGQCAVFFILMDVCLLLLSYLC